MRGAEGSVGLLESIRRTEAREGICSARRAAAAAANGTEQPPPTPRVARLTCSYPCNVGKKAIAERATAPRHTRARARPARRGTGCVRRCRYPVS